MVFLGNHVHHKKLPFNPDADELEVFYTFYSEEGFQISKETQLRAATVITFVQKASGPVCTTVCLR